MESDNSADWKIVLRYIIRQKSAIKEPMHIRNLCNALLQKISNSTCKNREITSRILNMHQRYLLSGIENTPPEEGDFLGYAKAFFESRKEVILQPLNFCNNTEFYDHENNIVYQLYDTPDIEKLHTAIDFADLNYAKIILNYGKLSKNKKFQDGENKFQEGAKYLNLFMSYMKSCMGDQATQYEGVWCPSALVVCMYRTRGTMGENRRGFEHVLVILRILKNIILKLEENSQGHSDNIEQIEQFVANHYEALQLYFNVVNLPFIPQDDVRDFINYFLNLLFFNTDRCRVLVEEMIDIYRGMFRSEITQVYEPRSLRHQSRCVVRDCLGYQNEPMPDLIDKLHVPQEIKELLLGAPEISS